MFQMLAAEEIKIWSVRFLSDPGVPGRIFVSGCPSVCHRCLWNLTDVTMADEDTNSILTDNANRAIQVNVATNWLYLVDKLYKLYKL